MVFEVIIISVFAQITQKKKCTIEMQGFYQPQNTFKLYSLNEISFTVDVVRKTVCDEICNV